MSADRGVGAVVRRLLALFFLVATGVALIVDLGCLFGAWRPTSNPVGLALCGITMALWAAFFFINDALPHEEKVL